MAAVKPPLKQLNPFKMAIKMVPSLFVTTLCYSICSSKSHADAAPSTEGGSWVLLQKSVGVSAMHAQLLHNNKVVILDRTNFGPSNLTVPAGKCRINEDEVLKVDCTAHSLLYDVGTNTFRPLTVYTDTWCSSGAVHPNGTLVQTGGSGEGAQKIRLFSPCDDVDQCDWVELSFPQNLKSDRWYASDQILPDGRVIVVGGRDSPNYEFFPKNLNDNSSMSIFNLQFLTETLDSRLEENNLYPFVHLMPDGNLFVFANNRSIILDYINNRIVREFPQLPGEKRNYPSTGSSVMLPLRLINNTAEPEVEVLICGGARQGSFLLADLEKIFSPAASTCARMMVTDPNATWVTEEMPIRRVMPDMVLLPTGEVAIINGAQNGTAGWDDADGPAFNPLLYTPDSTPRFAVLNPNTIPRMYHSVAILLPDGRILVGGSNPHAQYNFTGVRYPTELSLEAFSPDYMSPQYDNTRPTIISVEPSLNVTYGQNICISFTVDFNGPDQLITVTMIAPSFTTHSYSMNQRLLMLEVVDLQKTSSTGYNVIVLAPPTANIAPPGYYMVFVVNDGIPGISTWLKIEK